MDIYCCVAENDLRGDTKPTPIGIAEPHCVVDVAEGLLSLHAISLCFVWLRRPSEGALLVLTGILDGVGIHNTIVRYFCFACSP